MEHSELVDIMRKVEVGQEILFHIGENGRDSNLDLLVQQDGVTLTFGNEQRFGLQAAARPEGKRLPLQVRAKVLGKLHDHDYFAEHLCDLLTRVEVLN